MAASSHVRIDSSNFWLRSVHPDLTEASALQHDANVWTCLDTILGSPSAPTMAKVLASLSLSVGGGVEQLPQESGRCPLGQLGRLFTHGARPTPGHCGDNDHIVSRVSRGRRLVEDVGLDFPSWRELAETPAARVEDPEPGQPKCGWQQRATRMVEQSFVHTQVWPGRNGPTRALLRSQHGPLASAPFTAIPTSRVTRFDAQPFHLLLCRRLHLPLPLTLRTCRCGHHRAACAEAGVLGKRGLIWNVPPLRFVGKQEQEWPRMCGSETGPRTVQRSGRGEVGSGCGWLELMARGTAGN